MPEMDGLATLERIMSECPTPVVMLSSLTDIGSDATIKALELGAVDFFLKHNLANPAGNTEGADTLRNKIIMASRIRLACQKILRNTPQAEKPPKKALASLKPADRTVVIGTSTGGPKALYQVVPALPADLSAAVIIVQHMPPGFTGSLAHRLDQLSQLTVKEAAQGDVLHNGTAYVARGGYHLVIEPEGILALNQDPSVCGVRPSVDVTVMSAAQIFGDRLLSVILTGMGTDGTRGARQAKMRGGRVIAEDESTCVVWGMPRSVAEAGLADKIIPLPRIAQSVVETLQEQIQGVRND
jgi:two-component system, chemotaxis family, protein-glutamate methylesterase/glutaminase